MPTNIARGIFITGTDTGVGKTLASCLLMDALIKQGNNVVGMKPIASGGEKANGALKNDDAIKLIEHANVDAPYQLVNPYCFEPPIAPHIAARQSGQQIDLLVIEQAYNDLTKQADWVIVEGVGGWSVPINKQETTADIPSRLNLPVILVVGMKLGCINHALLTAEAIRVSDNNLIGWIANQIDLEMRAYNENLTTLNEMLGSPLIACVPHWVGGHSDPNKPTNIDLNILES